MNGTKNETVRSSMKPDPFLYALEFTRRTLIVGTLFGVIPSLGSVIYVKLSLLTIGVGVIASSCEAIQSYKESLDHFRLRSPSFGGRGRRKSSSQ
jgi:hypothetical protein